MEEDKVLSGVVGATVNIILYVTWSEISPYEIT